MLVGPTGGLLGAPWGSYLKTGTTFLSYNHIDIVDNLIVIQLIFAEIFVQQDFTIRTTPGLSALLKKEAFIFFFYLGLPSKESL